MLKNLINFILLFLAVKGAFWLFNNLDFNSVCLSSFDLIKYEFNLEKISYSLQRLHEAFFR